MTRAAAAALALALAACRHPTKVGPEGAQGGGGRGNEAPAQAQGGVPRRGEHPRVPASPKALLAEGEIAKVQDALARRGYLAKHEQGKLDDATTVAIKKFQKDQSLADTGFPDRLTLQLLGLDPEDAYSKVREEKRNAGSAGAGEKKP